MCTLTWQLEPSGYQVFFNRDEQRTRAIAKPVAFNASLDAVYPVDPQGGGTWIALTQAGSTFCLLNNYQAQATHQPIDPISRGEVILRLIAKLNDDVDGTHEERGDITHLIKALPLARFAPFILCFFPAYLNQHQGKVQQLQWDGQHLTCLPVTMPLTSSGFNISAVSAARYLHFAELMPQTTQDFLAYHASHQPQRSAFSVCMHREDAHTVSFSHVQVGEGEQVFNYYQGSPCQSLNNSDALTQLKQEKLIQEKLTQLQYA
ncbi:NRDE family protein [Thalassotalea euphylliae]|uniref:NRDE family protein n=1 Tax=Thalassotalea euphylliae TaxID=1655234 RepID=A0A3E0U1L6_9GAMM|nr:NRDE family protein [Thalassotalea euphylliae]REL30861.1 hypothetical protein DXX94_09085 [Thalassotalea euphylliae]